jgi:hypothetical protein
VSVTPAARFVRRFSGLLPLVIVAALFAAPVIIWIVKDDGPAIVTERLKARILSVGPDEKERRIVVSLEDGMTVVIRTDKVPADAKPGDDIEVLRSKQPTGEIDYDLDG